MITGAVTADREAVIRLAVRGPAGQEQGIEAVIDTGFDGWLSLPPALIALLGLQWRRRGRALLADGSESLFDIYEGTVVWDGNPRRVAVDGTAGRNGVTRRLRVERPSSEPWGSDDQRAALSKRA